MQTNDLKLSSKHIDCVLHSKIMFQKLSSSAERPGFWALSSVRPRTPATNGFPPPDLQWGRYLLISNGQLREFMLIICKRLVFPILLSLYWRVPNLKTLSGGTNAC